MYHTHNFIHLPLRTIRFCWLVIECDAVSLLMDDAGNAPIIHHCACVDRCGRGRTRSRRQVKRASLLASVPGEISGREAGPQLARPAGGRQQAPTRPRTARRQTRPSGETGNNARPGFELERPPPARSSLQSLSLSCRSSAIVVTSPRCTCDVGGRGLPAALWLAPFDLQLYARATTSIRLAPILSLGRGWRSPRCPRRVALTARKMRWHRGTTGRAIENI